MHVGQQALAQQHCGPSTCAHEFLIKSLLPHYEAPAMIPILWMWQLNPTEDASLAYGTRSEPTSA